MRLTLYEEIVNIGSRIAGTRDNGDFGLSAHSTTHPVELFQVWVRGSHRSENDRRPVFPSSGQVFETKEKSFRSPGTHNNRIEGLPEWPRTNLSMNKMMAIGGLDDRWRGLYQGFYFGGWHDGERW